jgi:hypothetical protein
LHHNKSFIILVAVVIFHWQNVSHRVICSLDKSMVSKLSVVQAGCYEFCWSSPLHFGKSTQLG